MISFPKAEIIKEGAVARMTEGIFVYSGWPSVCRDENGVLYAVASSFRTRHVCPFGKTAMYISRNDGKTWTPPIVINDTILDDRDAGIVYMGNGRMVVTWFDHPAENYLKKYYECITEDAGPLYDGPIKGMLEMYKNLTPEQAEGGRFIRISEDYGVTWSKIINIPVSSPHGPIQLKDGSLLYLGKELFITSMANEDDDVSTFVSTDGGYNWERKGVCMPPEGVSREYFCEPSALELPDGTILGMIRADGVPGQYEMTMYQSESHDGGETWSTMQPTGICGGPPHLMYHSSGAVICAFGRRDEPYGIQAVISYDNGKTWSEPYMIQDKCISSDLGYPCSVELTDGSILTVYYQRAFDEETGKFDNKTSIMYSHWKLPEKK